MNISIDARGINWYKGTGIGTYTEKVLTNMIKENNKDSFNIYWSGENYLKFKEHNTNIILTSRKHNKFFEQTYIPYHLNNAKCDVYHIPQNGIGISENINCKIVVTIHDLIPYIMPETVGRGYLNKFLKEMPKIIELSDKIITVSEWSKKDISKFFPMKKDKIEVIPLAADSKYKPLNKLYCKNVLKKKYGIELPFILYLGGFSSRKNVKSIIEAFEKIYNKLPEKHTLVIVGSKKDEGEKLYEFSRKLKISSNIIFTDFVEEQDLPIFYNGCSVFIYPSLYEGFGLPPLEAMSCGCAVIASNITSIPEVTSDCCINIDPFDVDNMSASMENILKNPELQDKLGKKALERSKLFSWEKTAKNTLNVYKSIFK
ncbi:glycosyltransferase family 4 protein [Clostridium tepidum]|jgi:glycosyltransferase involved in cell wall biosynthesis|uniref:Glycosyl transferase n=1 Tax=Clostridium tepidum TaxID=1962263 RepID=A0A1S9I7K9_9CLOT|nr:glycosyltransferase family 1 protein [Clostridium tepidum]MCR1935386.1 glycosyltransferase family 4 protein [Clostridium tepidum]MDU6877042.1 glycosyltransferase family 1 protein [Clostridium botulinum]OOO62913.1 glycosyl transferase [Clostridium tepidum]OOO66235.1 glycosyl transferase [Clostridium tepidum]